MSSEERRSKRRFACDVQARIECPAAGILPARAQDVSASGFCVLTAQPVAVGSRIGLELRLILQRAQSDALALPAVVVWCARARGGHQIGARFLRDAMTRGQLQQLEVLLQFLAGDLELPAGHEA